MINLDNFIQSYKDIKERFQDYKKNFDNILLFTCFKKINYPELLKSILNLNFIDIHFLWIFVAFVLPIISHSHTASSGEK